MTEAELQKIQIMWNSIMNMENVCIQTVSWMKFLEVFVGNAPEEGWRRVGLPPNINNILLQKASRDSVKELPEKESAARGSMQHHSDAPSWYKEEPASSESQPGCAIQCKCYPTPTENKPWTVQAGPGPPRLALHRSSLIDQMSAR